MFINFDKSRKIIHYIEPLNKIFKIKVKNGVKFLMCRHGILISEKQNQKVLQ